MIAPPTYTEAFNGCLANAEAAAKHEGEWYDRWRFLRRSIDANPHDAKQQNERVIAWATVCQYRAEVEHWNGYAKRFKAEMAADPFLSNVPIPTSEALVKAIEARMPPPPREPGADDDSEAPASWWDR